MLSGLATFQLISRYHSESTTTAGNPPTELNYGWLLVAYSNTTTISSISRYESQPISMTCDNVFGTQVNFGSIQERLEAGHPQKKRV